MGETVRVVGGKGGKQRKGFRDSSVKGSEGKSNGVRAFRDRKEGYRIGANSEKMSGTINLISFPFLFLFFF